MYFISFYGVYYFEVIFLRTLKFLFSYNTRIRKFAIRFSFTGSPPNIVILIPSKINAVQLNKRCFRRKSVTNQRY